MAEPAPDGPIRLRGWRDCDRAPFAALNADAEVMRYFPAPLGSAQSDAFATRISDDLRTQGWGLWAIEITGVAEFGGYVGLSRPRFDAPFTPCVEIGWRLAQPLWGHGYATRAAACVLDFAFLELGFGEVVSFTTLGNRPSRRVMEKLGMTHAPADDFEHPSIPADSELRRHVLYRVRRGDWIARRMPESPGG